MTALHWAAFGLSAITGVFHIYLHYTQAKPVFPFAGAVFLGAGLAGFPNVYRRALYALSVPFTAGQIVIRALMGIPVMSLAIVDKPIQAALIVLLAYPLVDEKRLIQDRTRHDFRLYLSQGENPAL